MEFKLTAISNIRILIVDDDRAILEVLREWFTLFQCMVDTAADGFEALRLAQQHPYEVIFTDLKLPSLDGHQLLALFKDLQPDAEVIFLTGQGTMEDAIKALREGKAFDFLQKPIQDFHRLNHVVEKALQKRARALDRPAKQAPPSHVEALTPREIEIVGLLAAGLDNAQIADRLFLSEKTIKNHLTRIYEKLKVSNRTQAVVSCQAYGFIKGWAPVEMP